MTGWNLPPGCNVRDIPGCGDDPPCQGCGRDPADCICPECPVCGEYGNPKCYDKHGLRYDKHQRIGQARMRIASLNEQLVTEAQYIDWLEMKPETWRDES